MKKIVENLVELIGETPLLKANRYAAKANNSKYHIPRLLQK